MTGSATPGHLTSFKVGGHFGAKGSSLNDRGAGDPLRRFSYASERSRSGTWSHDRHTESCKPNKTKQNKMGRVARPAQPVASPGCHSVAHCQWIGHKVAGLSRHRDPTLASHLRALSGDASAPIDTIPPSEFCRRTTHDDGRRCFWTPCEDVCRRGLLSCCCGPAPARSKPDRARSRHGHESVKVGQMRRGRINRP